VVFGECFLTHTVAPVTDTVPVAVVALCSVLAQIFSARDVSFPVVFYCMKSYVLIPITTHFTSAS
jgi:hypothetical protein